MKKVGQMPERKDVDVGHESNLLCNAGYIRESRQSIIPVWPVAVRCSGVDGPNVAHRLRVLGVHEEVVADGSVPVAQFLSLPCDIDDEIRSRHGTVVRKEDANVQK